MNHLRHLAAMLLYFLNFLHHVPTTYGYKHTTFYMQKDKGLPQGHTPALSQQTSTAIECARMCNEHYECYSFQAEKIRDNTSWTCHFLDVRLPKDDVPSGTGIYGVYFGYMSDDVSHPVIPGAQFLFETYIHSGTIAVYDCRKTNPAMGTVGILFDYEKGDWQVLNPTCALTLCNEPGLSATTLQIDPNIVTGIQTVTCKCTNSDEYISDVQCDTVTGEWLYEREPEVACLPTTCVRYTSHGKAVYAGKINETAKGMPCIAWEDHVTVQTTIDDGFPEDDSISTASNFCRDPYKTGRLECFQMGGGLMECDAPSACRWPFDI